MSWPGHPPTFGSQHPWLDPLAPQDFLNPRPDQEITVAGALAPRPEDFPFTQAGRQDYYAAVRSAAQQQLMIQHQQMHERAYAAHMEADRAARDALRRRQVNLLLLMP